jgi:hypothetical protein
VSGSESPAVRGWIILSASLKIAERPSLFLGNVPHEIPLPFGFRFLREVADILFVQFQLEWNQEDRLSESHVQLAGIMKQSSQSIAMLSRKPLVAGGPAIIGIQESVWPVGKEWCKTHDKQGKTADHDPDDGLGFPFHTDPTSD